eukprot:TRINITY_DN15534_c0_g1_i4.p1 TRINITY_DN15534_c0_g1~~TRINITY_DN15534_c0_g1_i4.p1  ORF type:complete len:191 (+),score=47.59 TRINITY_DN15534_c0_g1_i4:199-771(+)
MVPGVCLVPAPVLSLLAYGELSGVVISSGHVFTNVACVWEGSLIPGSVRELHGCAGQDGCQLADYLALGPLVADSLSSCTTEQAAWLKRKIYLAGANTAVFAQEIEAVLARAVHGAVLVPNEPELVAESVVIGAEAFCMTDAAKEQFVEQWEMWGQRDLPILREFGFWAGDGERDLPNFAASDWEAEEEQ